MHTLVSPGQTVSLIVLDVTPKHIPARIVTVSREMVIACEKPPKIGAAIRIDLSDGMLLGDVIGIDSQKGTILLAIRHSIHTAVINQIRQNWT
jgi:hypothetical protein